jgi:hypothetical protein
VFPFKACVCVESVIFLIVDFTNPHYRYLLRSADIPLILLFSCGLILLLGAILFAIFGPKGHAFSCVVFAFTAFLIASLFLPAM